MKRLAAALLGVAIGLAAVSPIQAQRLASAICAGDVDGIYEHMQHQGWTRLTTEYIVEIRYVYGIECSGAQVRGFVVTQDGPGWAVYIDDGSDLIYVLNFDLLGQLTEVR